jgi:hypothetical protein
MYSPDAPTYANVPQYPGQPVYGAPPSQPLYGDPASQPLYGASPSQPLYPGMPVAVMAPPAPAAKSRKKLWITLGAVAVLLVVVGGGATAAIMQYKAPADAATTFCGDLKAQSYSAAYGLLSAKLRSQFAQDQYTQVSTTLDTIQGKVTACGQSSASDAYSFSLGASTATVNAVLTREKAGNLQGAVRLVNENGAWKVDSLDTSLVGVSLGALQTAGAFCQDMATQNYAAAYGLLDSKAQAQGKQSDFATAAGLQDQVDGKVTACALVGLGTANTDASASLTASMTRAKLGQRQGTVTLTNQGGAWKVSDLDTHLQGTDITGLVVAIRFCADISSSNYADAYKLGSAHFLGSETEAQFASDVTITDQGQQIKLAAMQADPATYKVSGTTAQINVSLTFVIVSSGQQVPLPAVLKLAQASNGAWQVDDLLDTSGTTNGGSTSATTANFA